MNTVGQAVPCDELRKRLGLSLEGFAAFLDIPVESCVRLCQGITMPSRPIAEALRKRGIDPAIVAHEQYLWLRALARARRLRGRAGGDTVTSCQDPEHAVNDLATASQWRMPDADEPPAPAGHRLMADSAPLARQEPPEGVPLTVPLPDLFSAPAKSENRPLSGQFFHSRRTPLQAIRAFCLQCVGGARREVEHCPARECPLYDRRFGVRPKTAQAQGRDVGREWGMG